MVLRNTTIVQRRLKFFEIRVEKSSAVDSFLEQREASVKKKKKKNSVIIKMTIYVLCHCYKIGVNDFNDLHTSDTFSRILTT